MGKINANEISFYLGELIAANKYRARAEYHGGTVGYYYCFFNSDGYTAKLYIKHPVGEYTYGDLPNVVTCGIREIHREVPFRDTAVQTAAPVQGNKKQDKPVPKINRHTQCEGQLKLEG